MSKDNVRVFTREDHYNGKVTIQTYQGFHRYRAGREGLLAMTTFDGEVEAWAARGTPLGGKARQ